ncbi:hypothetical protein KL86DPRO_60208 [uncultured delta proteobacterium]|uniref:Uncharacterized protein n=1 Tax=uncultured delta proteobacterium TaxID=34034 RepID=A0A212KFQ7_9DELT|nr:hypothetical protein KL86DPRO_60208 [uncultured delta proteobacterium]
MQKVGQKTGFVTGVGDSFFFNNLTVVGVKNGKGFTMSEVSGNVFAV